MDTVNTGLNQIYTRSENHSDQNNFSQWDDFRFHIDSQFDEEIQKFKYTLGLENKITGDSQSWLVHSEDHWLYALPGASAYCWSFATNTFKRALKQILGLTVARKKRDEDLAAYLKTCRSPFKLECARHWTKVQDAQGTCYILPRRGGLHGTNVSFRHCADLADSAPLELCAHFLKLAKGKLVLVDQASLQLNLKLWLANFRASLPKAPQVDTAEPQRAAIARSMLRDKLQRLIDFYHVVVSKIDFAFPPQAHGMISIVVARDTDAILDSAGAYLAVDSQLFVFMTQCEAALNSMDMT